MPIGDRALLSVAAQRRALAACVRVMINVCYTVSYRHFSD
jgi:hypothetical protein